MTMYKLFFTFLCLPLKYLYRNPFKAKVKETVKVHRASG